MGLVGVDIRMYESTSPLMLEEVAGFDWDTGHMGKCQKHGVPVAEIEALLRSDAGIAPDPDHSAHEDRFIAVGSNSAGRPLFVAFTFGMKDGQRLIRPVSARYMHKKEIEAYETESP
jgi:uncharacterized DUF497 family protein